MANDFFSIRASSISDALDCGYRFEGKYLLGMRLPASGPAHLGTSIHYGTAAFDRARVALDPITSDAAVGEFIDKLYHPQEDVNWGDSSIKEAERIGLRLTSKYCTDVSPHYEFRAVEMATTPFDITMSGMTIQLTGTMDRSRMHISGKGLGVVDLKSGKRAVKADGSANTSGHIFQLATYEILTEHTTGLPITEEAEIIGLSTAKDARIGTAKISNAKEALLGAPGEKGVLEMLAEDLKEGNFRPNPRSALCSERYCARWKVCRYHA